MDLEDYHQTPMMILLEPETFIFRLQLQISHILIPTKYFLCSICSCSFLDTESFFKSFQEEQTPGNRACTLAILNTLWINVHCAVVPNLLICLYQFVRAHHKSIIQDFPFVFIHKTVSHYNKFVIEELERGMALNRRWSHLSVSSNTLRQHWHGIVHNSYLKFAVTLYAKRVEA